MKIFGVPVKTRYLLVAVALAFLTLPSALQAGMTDYCIVPPYVVQNVPPNVMIVVDVSGSMYNFAYFDGFNTTATGDDHDCTSSDPCSGFTAPGTYPTYKYYGYFDSDSWYTYGSSRFSVSRPKPPGRKIPGQSGRELAQLAVHAARGHRAQGPDRREEADGINNQLDTEVADCDSRGDTKTASNASLYTPFSGSRTFTVNDANAGCAGGGSGVSSVTVSGTAISGYPTTFTGSVVVPTPVEGVLQSTVGARARLGLTFYNTNSGGSVRDGVSGTSTSLANVVSHINTTRPTTNTPLGETLWTVTGYFAQDGSMLSGPGPMYNSGDFGIGNGAGQDPWNYGTSTAPRRPICAKSFVLYITDGEPCSDGNLPASLSNYASGRSAFNCSGGSCPSVAKPNGGSFTASTFPSCSAGGYTAGIEDVALYMHTTDLRSSTLGANDMSGTQNLTLYTIFAFGKGSTLLRYAAINGGFEDNGSHVPTPQSTWDKNNDGEPDNFYEAFDGAELENAARDALSGILKRASSGTAASVLASGEGSGANLIQAVFYPRRPFGDDIVWWTGSLQNMWYFVDPFFANANIREETTVDSKLNLTNDYIAQFYFDNVAEVTKVRRWVDANGDGVADNTAALTPDLGFENLSSLWEAGKRLWLRNLGSAPRTIYTTLNGSTLIPFSTGNATLNSALLPDTGDNPTTIINYVHGIDNTSDPNLRSRTVQQGASTGVWKLGDIVDSTPRIVSGIPLNKYDEIYSDTTYKSFIDNNNYKNRGMVFSGGNDGMLHAFRLGKLELAWTGKTAVEKARLSAIGSTTMGDEAWGFIPKNALPYLKYLKDPDYCHLFYVDLSPYIFDASIGSGSGDQSNQTRTQASWRTVLVGGMRYGGACSNTCTSGQDCVKTPATDSGFSSYFAIDVTNPESPSLMWEFSSPALGFATTGPAIVRTNAVNSVTSARDSSLNGEWYVMVGSGPTGPIDNTNSQFLGRSNQNLKYFVLNLKTGALVQTIDTGVQFAFGGSMINSVADFNLDYQDDAVYVGYVKKNTSVSPATWTDGGIGRIFTKNGSPGTSPWVFSKVIDGIGPVTSAIARLQNKNFDLNWLFAGTGRYFFENPPTATSPMPDIDDADGQRRLIAVKEPCFSGGTVNSACTTTVVFPSSADANFPNVSSIGNVPTEGTANGTGFKGWYVNLDASDNTAATPFRAERMITDPLATLSGTVFFTTYAPYAAECSLGGKSFLWALRYNTGAAPLAGVMKGKALVQVSTASVEQIDLSKAFTPAFGGGKDGRRTAAIEGVPPTAQGLSLLSQPPPVKRIMHMIER